MNKKKSFFEQGLLIVFLGMCLLFSLLSKWFLTPSNIFSVLRQASVLFLLAAGQSLVVITGGIDLSHGSLIGLCSTITGLTLLNIGLLPGIFIGLLVAIVAGFITGVLIGRTRLEPFIATLGMMFALEGITLIITEGQPIFGISDNVLKFFTIIGQGYLGPVPIPVIILLIFIGIMYIVLHRMRFGRHIFAVGGNETAARLSGVNITMTKTLAYTLNGFLVGMASLILTSRAGSGQPLMGGGMLMESIGAVVVGGVSLKGGSGSIFQVLLGVFFMVFMVNGLDILGISTFIKELLVGCIIIFGVMLRSRTNQLR